MPEDDDKRPRISNLQYGQQRLMPEQPWWRNLSPAFYKYPDDFNLNLGMELLIGSTAALDMGLRTAIASLVSTLAIPLSLSRLPDDHQHRVFYQALADQQHPGAFFKPPPTDISIHAEEAGKLAFHPPQGHSYLLSFESPFQTVNPAERENYRKLKRNLTAWAEYWRHDERPRPTLCVIHGFMADPYWVNSRFLSLPWFYKQGYDILLYTLPFHGRRQTGFSPFSGHGFFAHGISHINETMAHAVHDFRIFLDWLFSQGAPKIGVTGISLGGYTTALLAAVDDRLHFAIPNVPVVSLMDLMLEWFPAGPLIRTMLRSADISIVEARHTMAVHCPLTYPPLLPRDRLMIIGGVGDRLAPPKHTRLLWDHWQRPRLHWFPGNHIIHLDQGKYLREMAEFIEATGFKAS